MFLHYLLQQDEKSVLYLFFQKQQECPNNGDWWLDVQQDLVDLKLMTSLDEIRRTSKISFKNKVRIAVQEAALEFLNSSKKDKSKLKDLYYDELKIQEYLISDELLTSEKKAVVSTKNKND